MTRPAEGPLADCQRRYRELAARVARLGYIRAGSVVLASNRCGKPGCRCHDDPPQLHGPYWQYTAKINGKTVTRRLTEQQARQYQEWISNDRALRDLITQMRQVAAEATTLIAQQSNAPEAAGQAADHRRQLTSHITGNGHEPQTTTRNGAKSK